MSFGYPEPISDPRKSFAIKKYIGTSCVECEHEYADLDDIIAKDPQRADTDKFALICRACKEG